MWKAPQQLLTPYTRNIVGAKKNPQLLTNTE